MENYFHLHLQEDAIGNISNIGLAHLGDAVYELCARAYVVAQQNRPVGELHQQVVTLVNAGAQSAALERLLPLLTPEELAIFKRGRNASASSVPKHAEIADYRRATGVEALFGYLFLKGERQRLEMLFAKMNGLQE